MATDPLLKLQQHLQGDGLGATKESDTLEVNVRNAAEWNALTESLSDFSRQKVYDQGGEIDFKCRGVDYQVRLDTPSMTAYIEVIE